MGTDHRGMVETDNHHEEKRRRGAELVARWDAENGWHLAPPMRLTIDKRGRIKLVELVERMVAR